MGLGFGFWGVGRRRVGCGTMDSTRIWIMRFPWTRYANSYTSETRLTPFFVVDAKGVSRERARLGQSVRPDSVFLDCAGINTRTRSNIGHNDVMANFSLTLVDNLDTFVALNNRSGFDWAVRQTIDVVSFNQDAKPQVSLHLPRVLFF